MEMGLAKGWVPVALDAQIAPGSSHPVVINDMGLAVWRGSSGGAQVWEDRCPHRGMRLSFGFVRDEGLVCLYHGWEFSQGGKCRKIPAHPELDPPKTICTRTFGSLSYRGIVFASLDKAATPDLPADSQEEWLPVRSVFVAVPMDRVATYLGAKDNVFGAVATADGLGCHRLALADGAQITVALQPVGAEKAAVHLTSRGADADLRRTLARYAVRMRRILEIS